MSARIRKLIFDGLVHPLHWAADRLVPKDPAMWGFAAHHIKSDQFIENARAVFECVKTDSSIRKIIFARSQDPDFELDGMVNTQVVPLQSLTGLLYLLRCRVLFVTHSVSMDYAFRWGRTLFSVVKLTLPGRIIVNLWHGVAFKAQYALANAEVRGHLDRVRYRRRERQHYTGVISSSRTDRHAMAAIFHPIHPDRVWVTGLPRNDFLVRPLEDLPRYLQSQVARVRSLTRGKRLIVYAPTYRQVAAVAGADYYQFTEAEVASLKAVLKDHDAVLGFRMHYFRNSNALFNLERFVDTEWIIDLGHSVIPEFGCLLRETDLLITDYSSVYLEALYLRKPVIGFVYDYDDYTQKQDGLIYDADFVFPGPLERDFKGLLAAIEHELRCGHQVSSERYNFVRRFYFTHTDDGNSARVVAQVQAELCKGAAPRGLDGRRESAGGQ